MTPSMLNCDNLYFKKGANYMSTKIFNDVKLYMKWKVPNITGTMPRFATQNRYDTE